MAAERRNRIKKRIKDFKVERGKKRECGEGGKKYIGYFQVLKSVPFILTKQINMGHTTQSSTKKTA